MLKFAKKIDFAILFMVAVYVSVLFIYKDALLCNTDNVFLLNRAQQMLHCIRDGNIPFFYYDDFKGIGYGSAFFYGHLTLYPFLPLLLLGKLPFLYGYIMASLIMSIIGVKAFVKRFCSNSRFVSDLYLLSISFFMLFVYTQLYACIMGQALGFLFLAYLVDFLRDKKSFLPSGLLFFLVINTHLLTAFVVFLIAVYMGIIYFDKNRIKEYVLYFVYVLSLCLYFICNYFYHREALNDIQSISKFSLGSGIEVKFGYTVPVGLFESYVFTKKLGCNTYFDICTFVTLIFLLIKNRKKLSIKEKATIGVCVCLLILGLTQVWHWFNLHILTLPFQFSLRYVPFILVYLYCISLQYAGKDLQIFLKSYVLFLLILLFICYQLSNRPVMQEYTEIDKYVGNGEYVSKNFYYTPSEIENATVHDNNTVYDYTEKKGKLVVEINTNGTKKITVPKLFYKGYKAKFNGENVKILSKITNFITVEVEGNGTLEIYYSHPWWLKLLDLGCLIEFMTAMIVFSERSKQ